VARCASYCPKHVENRNKHKRKKIRQFVYLQGSHQDAPSTKHKKPVSLCQFNISRFSSGYRNRSRDSYRDFGQDLQENGLKKYSILKEIVS